jgi:tetratricopeptide (TPR) repeat protein
MRPLPSVRRALVAAALLLAAASGLRAQAIGQGFDLERAGQLDQAASSYLAAARGDPTDLPALLGLERVLPQLDRLRELLPLAQRAAALSSTSDALRALLLRTYVALNEPDSARSVARRWARARPHDEEPYREWAIALSEKRAYDDARQVLLAGRAALGQPAAFAIEVAELQARVGDWEGAAREWSTAVTAAPEHLANAATQLSDAPPERRERIARLLTATDASAPTVRLAAELELAWGDAPRAWAIFAPTVVAPSAEAADALHRFADRAAAPGTAAAWRVRGLALSRFAGLVPGPQAVRARTDAARAFLQAGDTVAARTQMERVAADPAAPPEAQQLAEATLIGALIQEGRLDSAATRIRGAGDLLGIDDRADLRRSLAQARIRHGELALADAALANDSSVQALALQGWIALYRGDLRSARALFRAAGPYAGDRRAATERTAMLALIEQIPGDRLPALGSALLTLGRGDSAAAVTALREVADRFTPAGGRADLLLLAGRVAVQLGSGGERTAAALFEDVVRTGGTGAAAPAAELEWARLLARHGRNTEAVQHLEHLILSYPGSAVVPEARRELERARGAIPKS